MFRLSKKAMGFCAILLSAVCFQNCSIVGSQFNSALDLASQQTLLPSESNDKRSVDLGNIFNFDGDFMFLTDSNANGLAAVKSRIPLAEDFQSLSVNCYTGVRYYYTGNEADRDKTFGFRDYKSEGVTQARLLFESNPIRDPLREFATATRENGKKFVLGFRVADAHYISSPEAEMQAYPWTPSLVTDALKNSTNAPLIGAGMVPSFIDFGKMLDFTRPEVHQTIEQEIMLALNRYQDVIDGFQLDFTRYPILFPYGQGPAQKPVFNSIVKNVREAISRMETEQNRTIALIVLIPPTLQANSNAGLDVKNWVENKYVDVIVPSYIMTTDDSIDPDLLKLAQDNNVTLYGSLMGRKAAGNYTASELPANSSEALKLEAITSTNLKGMTTPLLKSFGVAMRVQRVKNIEAYNWAFDKARLGFIHQAVAPEAVSGPFIYSAIRQYYNGEVDRYYLNPNTQLPLIAEANTEYRLRIYIPRAMTVLKNKRIFLRVGTTNEDFYSAKIFAGVNGGALTPSIAAKVVSSAGVNGEKYLLSKPYSVTVSKYFYWDKSVENYSTGWNEVVIRSERRVPIVSLDILDASAE